MSGGVSYDGIRHRTWEGGESWVLDFVFTHPTEGWKRRIRKHAELNTRKGAEQERDQIRSALLHGTFEQKAPTTFREFVPKFMQWSVGDDKAPMVGLQIERAFYIGERTSKDWVITCIPFGGPSRNTSANCLPGSGALSSSLDEKL